MELDGRNYTENILRNHETILAGALRRKATFYGQAHHARSDSRGIREGVLQFKPPTRAKRVDLTFA
jgi:hypothetical protein